MRPVHPVVIVLPLSLVACSPSSSAPGTPLTDGAAPPDAPVPATRDATPEAAAPYTQTLLQNAHVGSDPSKPDFQNATADVTLPGAPFASVRLIVDLVSPCFPWSKWQSDPPPAGQNWPADCDAFDRNFEVSLTDPSAPQGTPALELVRAITP